MRRILLTLFLVSLMIVASTGVAKADSILFPYIANTDGNLDTLITVINISNQPQLHYRYFTKAAAAVSTNPCNEHDFFRPTTPNDVVVFATGRNSGLGGGNAMFNDATNYNAGVGAPNFGHIHGSGRYGLLMVTTANANTDVQSDVAQTPDQVPFFGELTQELAVDGEASLYDIATGAMWGYRAMPSRAEAGVGGVAASGNSYAFAFPVCGDACGASTHAMVEDIDATIATSLIQLPKISIYPPNQFTGRLFVTPLVNALAAAPATVADVDMRFPNAKAVNVGLRDSQSQFGMIDRNEQPVSSGGPAAVRCVGRIDVAALLGGALGPLAPTGPLFTSGGWAYVDLLNSAAIAAADGWGALVAGTGEQSATVRDLKFGNVTGMTGMVNDGKVLLDWGWNR